jgi:hypothetical protein
MSGRRGAVAAALALALSAAAGCSSVYSTRPVGGKPADIERESREWEGTWLSSGSAFTVAVADCSNGVLRIGWVERDGGRLYLAGANPVFTSVENIVAMYSAALKVQPEPSRQTRS